MSIKPSNLIDLRASRRYKPDVVSLACRRVAAARHQTGLSRPAFASSLQPLLGWTPSPEVIKSWESAVAPPGEVVVACEVVSSQAAHGAQILHSDASPKDTSPILATMPPPKTLNSADVSKADARSVIAWVESTNTSDDAISYFAQAISRTAEEHASLPPATLLLKVQQLHTMIRALLEGGRQRQSQASELLCLDADLLAHLCQLLGDVHRDQAASAYAQASMALANEAGAGPARAFSAQAQIARWRGRYTEAADLAAIGSRRNPPVHLRTLLAYQEADAAAVSGQVRRARTLLERADSMDDGSTSYSAWSCPPGRRALFRMGVALNLGDAHGALRQAAEAEPAWQRERSRAFGTWAHFQITAAKAHTTLASIDGATDQVAPVLDLPREYRISTLVGHMATLDSLLLRQRFRNSRGVVALRERLRHFSDGTLEQTNAEES